LGWGGCGANLDVEEVEGHGVLPEQLVQLDVVVGLAQLCPPKRR
jgi:hypothetical protein